MRKYRPVSRSTREKNQSSSPASKAFHILEQFDDAFRSMRKQRFAALGGGGGGIAGDAVRAQIRHLPAEGVPGRRRANA